MKNCIVVALFLVICVHTLNAKTPPKSCTINCLIADPVCSTKGTNYGCGREEACCHDDPVKCKGHCPCACTIECLRYEPVCGKSGATYGCGPAEAACYNDTVLAAGECPPCSSPLPTPDENPEQTHAPYSCANVRCAAGTTCKETPLGPRCQKDVCAGVKCKEGYQCIAAHGKGGCVAIQSCKLLACAEGEICKPIASCKGDTSKCPKSCQKKGSCICEQIYKPVCGDDGQTYSNDCTAACNGVEVAHQGACSHGCICPEYYLPVCSPSGAVYANPCFAQCAGVTNYVKCGAEAATATAGKEEL